VYEASRPDQKLPAIVEDTSVQVDGTSSTLQTFYL